MTSSQRATLTKQLLKQHNRTGDKWRGLTITIQLADNCQIIYHSGGSYRTHKGFKFIEGGKLIGRITYSNRDESYSVEIPWPNGSKFSTTTFVNREAFHDVMREHPPLMEWILFNGF